jgi:hypothetical protein
VSALPLPAHVFHKINRTQNGSRGCIHDLS